MLSTLKIKFIEVCYFCIEEKDMKIFGSMKYDMMLNIYKNI